MSQEYSLGEIAAHLHAELCGSTETRITGLNSLKNASEGQIAFLSNPKYASQLSDCNAEAVILTAAQAEIFSGSCLILENPYLG